MSDAGNFGGFGTGQNRPRFEDRTTGPGSRDAWNNKIQADDDGGRVNAGGNGTGGVVDDKNVNKDKDSIDDDVIDTIWDAHVNKDNNNNNNNNNQNNQNNNNNNNNQQQQQSDPKKQMNDYLSSVGLDPIVLTDKDKEDLQGGNYDNLINTFNTKLVNAHVKALSGSETMIQAAVKKAITETKTEMLSSREGEKNRDLLHMQMPWTKDKAISPVAQSVMQRFINKGMSSDDALKGTKAYFDRMNNAMNNDGVNKNRNANFSSGHRNGPQSDAPDGGWLAVLTGNGRTGRE